MIYQSSYALVCADLESDQHVLHVRACVRACVGVCVCVCVCKGLDMASSRCRGAANISGLCCQTKTVQICCDMKTGRLLHVPATKAAQIAP